MEFTNELLEKCAEAVHKAYCNYHLQNKGVEYWTKGDYSLLDEPTKQIDRETVKAVFATIKANPLEQLVSGQNTGGLLPCPFCGSKSDFVKYECQDGMGIYIKCTDTNCRTRGKLFSEWDYRNMGGTFNEQLSKNKAKEWWNKRPSVLSR